MKISTYVFHRFINLILGKENRPPRDQGPKKFQTWKYRPVAVGVQRGGKTVFGLWIRGAHRAGGDWKQPWWDPPGIAKDNYLSDNQSHRVLALAWHRAPWCETGKSINESNWTFKSVRLRVCKVNPPKSECCVHGLRLNEMVPITRIARWRCKLSKGRRHMGNWVHLRRNVQWNAFIPWGLRSTHT